MGTANPADMMTKHLLREPLDKCMKELNQCRMSGRARSGLDIQGSGKAPAGEVKIGSIRTSEVNYFWQTERRVRFQSAEVIAVQSWKEETKAMNYRSEGRIPLGDPLRAFVG